MSENPIGHDHHNRGSGGSRIRPGKLHEHVLVDSEAELQDAFEANEKRIRLEADLTAKETLSAVYDNELQFDLNGHTIRRAPLTPDRLIDIESNNYRVEVRNGLLDCNRRNQDFPSDKGYKELAVSGSRNLFVEGVDAIDNQGFTFNFVDTGDTRIHACKVDSNPIGLGSDAAGLDGIHLFDPGRVEVEGVYMRTGDDGIAITSRESSLEGIDVSGVFETPEYANGVKVYFDPSAGSALTIRNVALSVTVPQASGKGVILNDESGNDNPIRNLNADVTIRDTGGDAFEVNTPLEHSTITGSMAESVGGGIKIGAGGANLSTDVSIEDVSGSLVALTGGVEGMSITGAFDGKGNASRGIQMIDASDISISGAHIRDIGGNNHGVNASNSSHVSVTGCTFNTVAAPINTFNGSDYFTVVGNSGQSVSGSLNLDGANNVTASNNF